MQARETVPVPPLVLGERESSQSSCNFHRTITLPAASKASVKQLTALRSPTVAGPLGDEAPAMLTGSSGPPCPAAAGQTLWAPEPNFR